MPFMNVNLIVAVWMHVVIYWVAWCNNISSVLHATETRRINQISSRLGYDTPIFAYDL